MHPVLTTYLQSAVMLTTVIEIKPEPNIRARDNYVGEVHSAVTVDRGQQRYFSASKFANGACLLAVQSERSICAYLWAGPESKNFA